MGDRGHGPRRHFSLHAACRSRQPVLTGPHPSDHGRPRMLGWSLRRLRSVFAAGRRCMFRFEEPSALSWRKSVAASERSQSRKVMIFGKADVALGQTIQYVLDTGTESTKGLTNRPLIKSHAANVVRASAMPCPLIAASMI